MEMKSKWNRYLEPKKLSNMERKRTAWSYIKHQNDFERIDYDPVDIRTLFRPDGMIHLCR